MVVNLFLGLEDAVAHVAVEGPQGVADGLSRRVATLEVGNLRADVAEIGTDGVAPVAYLIVMAQLEFDARVAHLAGVLHRGRHTQHGGHGKLQQDVARLLAEPVEAYRQAVAPEGGINAHVPLSGFFPGDVLVRHHRTDGDTWTDDAAEGVVVAELVDGLVGVIGGVAAGIDRFLVTQQTP